MAIWPFGRRGSRRRSRIGPYDNPHISTEAPERGRRDRPQPRTIKEPASSTVIANDTGDGSRLTRRRSRAYSFSPGRQDALPVAKLRKRSTILGLGPGGGAVPNDEIAQRVPTLHHDSSKNKRRGQPLPRKKSSKRRKEDHDREAEIKAMSQFMPARPATDSWTMGRPVRKESRQLGKGLGGNADHPSSDISLPLPESIHSAMTSDSEHISWKVSALDALAPRPTLRYASNPIMGSNPVSVPGRSQSARKRLAGPNAISESELHAHRRIHDLADDLDASDLRELMERDKRRRMRKAEKDRERAERRLARRAEKQRAEEAAAVMSGTTPPANLERGVLGRELPDSGGNRTSAIVTSSKRRSVSDSPGTRSRPSSKMEQVDNHGKTPTPLDTFFRMDSVPQPELSSSVEAAESTAAPPRRARSRRSPSSGPKILDFIRSMRSRSTSPIKPGQQQPTPPRIHSPPRASVRHYDTESGSRTSDSRSSRHWLSLFRWRRKYRPSSAGPSSFSNTSRDSRDTMQVTQPTPPTNYMSSRKTTSGVPKRTMSRFREDLPEFPISPPDSRVASPEAGQAPVEPLPVIPDDVSMRDGSPVSKNENDYSEGMRTTPISIQRNEVQPSPALHSMSLASVDSEASWLSGRMSRKRTSSGIRTSLQHPPRTVSALSGRSEGRNFEHEQSEDDNIVDDEYLNRVVPTRLHRLSTGEARPSSDEEEESQPKWGAAVGQTPTFIQHRDSMRSREGLVQFFHDDEKEFGNPVDSEDDGVGQSPAKPQRARSVKLGKGHVRNFSAGSAKLLDVFPRQSTEHRGNAL